ncbi:MAG TPA: FtsQ-type POTRA domain-containing protein [Polyangiaceae bacterium]
MTAPGKRHGAAIPAPLEEFAVGESPPPAKAGPRAGRREPEAPSSPSGAARLLLGLKLFAGLVVVVAASSAVAFSLHRYALTTTRFGIRTVEIQGNKRLGAEEVKRLGGIDAGKNLLAFDTAQAERRLLENPWVSSARVTRELPGTLRVELAEREASAIAVLGDRPYLVTREGEPFKPIQPDDPSDLPIVSGVGAADLARDRAAAVERLKTGVDLLRQYERLAVARVHPAEEVALAASGHTVLTVGRAGIALELGRPPYARKLVMAAQVLGELGAKGQKPGIVFLDNEAHPERVVVRMR